jgi:hypothetical protein
MWQNKPAVSGLFQSKRPMCTLWTFESGSFSTITNFNFEYTTNRQVEVAGNLIPKDEIIMWGDDKLNVEVVSPSTLISHTLTI